MHSDDRAVTQARTDGTGLPACGRESPRIVDSNLSFQSRCPHRGTGGNRPRCRLHVEYNCESASRDSPGRCTRTRSNGRTRRRIPPTRHCDVHPTGWLTRSPTCRDCVLQPALRHRYSTAHVGRSAGPRNVRVSRNVGSVCPGLAVAATPRRRRRRRQPVSSSERGRFTTRPPSWGISHGTARSAAFYGIGGSEPHVKYFKSRMIEITRCCSGTSH